LELQIEGESGIEVVFEVAIATLQMRKKMRVVRFFLLIICGHRAQQKTKGSMAYED
jgi:hypothetical protein